MDTIEKARALMREHKYSARQALNVVRTNYKARRVEMEDNRYGETVGHIEIDGFDLTVKWEYDEWYQGDYDLTDTWRKGAVQNPLWRPEQYGRDRHYRWIVLPMSWEDHYEGLHKMGYSRGQAAEMAREYVNQDVKRIISEEPYYNVSVTASRAGIELGCASMGGTDLGEDYRQAREWMETLPDEYGLLDEAVAVAKDNLKKLCGGNDG